MIRHLWSDTFPIKRAPCCHTFCLLLLILLVLSQSEHKAAITSPAGPEAQAVAEEAQEPSQDLWLPDEPFPLLPERAALLPFWRQAELQFLSLERKRLWGELGAPSRA